MGRIRKLAAWTLSPGGNMHGLVRAESSAEMAAREHAQLLREQSELLATLARNNQRPAQPSARIPHTGVLCCVDCLKLGCDEAMGSDVDATLVAAKCDCQVHHAPA